MRKATARTEEASLMIPKRVFYGQGSSMMIGTLLSQAESGYMVDSNPDKSLRPVLGYLVPRWQRELKWTDEQHEQFIRSIYTGVYIGAFIYNDSITEAPKLNGLLVDGQQRLFAIQRYVAGDLAVLGRNGKKHRWTDLSEEDRRHFTRMTIGFEVVRIADEAELVELYNIFNYGGTPHDDSERAVL